MKCESTLAARGTLLFPDAMFVGSQILLTHSPRGEALQKPLMACLAIDRRNSFHGLHGFFDAFDDESGHSFVNNFRNRSAAKSDDWRATGHGLDHDQAEWLRPVDGKQQGSGIAKKISLFLFADLADKFDIGICQEIADLRFEVVAIGIVNLGCNAQWHPGLARNLDGSIDPFLRRDSAQKCQVFPR